MNHREWLNEWQLEQDYATRYGTDPPSSPLVREHEHDEALERRDRLATFDENRVRALLRPRTGNVEPAPRHVPVDET